MVKDVIPTAISYLIISVSYLILMINFIISIHAKADYCTCFEAFLHSFNNTEKVQFLLRALMGVLCL